MNECPPDQVQIAREILDYLSRQPSREDTLEGIMHHRLPDKPTDRQLTLIKEVAEDLVTQGLLDKRKREGRMVYCVKSRA